MPGIRIHHPTLRSCVCIVPHPGDRRTNRRPKDYPITLDDDGNCIVSETVWRRLQEARKSQLSTHNFIVLNAVENPPTIGIGWGPEKPDMLPTYREEHSRIVVAARRAAQRLAPKGIRPRITTRRISNG